MTNDKKNVAPGKIFVVATPIGHLGDFSPRAKEVLTQVDLIAAEDTRHSAKLLNLFQINTPLTAYHEHNELQKAQTLINSVLRGDDIALISDAGTPLVSDPGYRLIHLARKASIEILAVPGPCAAIAALSIAGVPSDKFFFGGFLPAKKSSRLKALSAFLHHSHTVILYESSHRIVACLENLCELNPEKSIIIARELTKTFETVLEGSAKQVLELLKQDVNQQKGEFVLIFAPEIADAQDSETIKIEVKTLLKALLGEMSVKKAALLASQITGMRKNLLYEQALNLVEKS